jgi:hypothetical protein
MPHLPLADVAVGDVALSLAPQPPSLDDLVGDEPRQRSAAERRREPRASTPLGPGPIRGGASAPTGWDEPHARQGEPILLGVGSSCWSAPLANSPPKALRSAAIEVSVGVSCTRPSLHAALKCR